MSILDELITANGFLVIDGAMGTELFSRGLPAGEAPERWNLDDPERVRQVHQAYIEAGSDIILTNTFGGTKFRLALHSLDDQVFEINRAAAQNAREAADSVERVVLVAGSMGPSGELMSPLGPLEMDDAIDGFAEQARGLDAGGADLLWIETMSSLDEVEAAVRGAMRVSDLPVTATLSFDTAGRTMMGVTGTLAAQRLVELGVAAIGANCGNNLSDTEAALLEIRRVAPDIPIISKANAGIPEWHGAELNYSGSPDVMAAHAHRVRSAGVDIIGGCCGSGPEHIAAMRGVLDGTSPVPEVDAPTPPERDESHGAGRTRRGGRRRSRG